MKKEDPRITQWRKILPCHACGIDSVYAPQMDLFIHWDGSDNRECWAMAMSGKELPYRTAEHDKMLSIFSTRG